MTVVANAWVEIAPSMEGFYNQVRSNLQGLDSAGAKAGKSMGNKMSGALGKAFKASAVGVGLATGGVLAGSIAKGMGRLTAIEGAQAKLKGLGNSAEDVAGIMDNALASVKGTAHGLGEAASTSAMLVAAGVKQGKDLETTLKTVGDVASIAGRSMGDVGLIFGSVAARGKLQGDDMLQLMSSGVPVLQLLADELDTTSAEVSDMVTKGKIDFETFEKAMREGMGGAALEMGNTFQGAFKNMGAAMGRFGAIITKPMFDAAVPAFKSIGSIFDAMGKGLEGPAGIIGRRITPALQNLSNFVKNSVAPVMEDLATKFGYFAARKVYDLLSPDSLNRAGELWQAFSNGVRQTWDAVKPLIPALGQLVGPLTSVASSISVSTWKVFGSVLTAVAPLVESVLVPVVDQVARFAEQNPSAVTAIVGGFLGFKAVSSIVGPLGKFVSGIKLAGSAIKGLGLAMAANPVGAVIAGVALAGTALWAFFTKTETGRKMWAKMVEVMKATWENLKNALQAGWKFINDKVVTPFKLGFQIAKSVLRKHVLGMIAGFVDFRNRVSASVQAVRDKFELFVAGVKAIPGKIKDAFKNAGSWLLEAGKAIIRGLARGIRNAGGVIRDAVKAVVPDAMERFVPGLHLGGVIPAFARGGVLPDIPGVSRSQRDPILGWSKDKKRPVARVEPGEFIVNRKATKQFLPLLAAINGGKLNPRQGDMGLPGYADGGVVGFRDIMRFLRGQSVNGNNPPGKLEGAPYIWGGGLNSNWGDCSGLQSGVAALAAGVSTAGRKFATMNQASWLSAHGFSRGRGPGRNAVETGFFNGGPFGGHTAGTLYDANGRAVNFEMGGARGNGQLGGPAAGARDPQFTDIWWKPLRSAADDVAGVLSTSVDGVTVETSDGDTNQIDWGTASALADEWKKDRERRRKLGLYNAGLFDTGGLLKHGQVAFNASGRPERVLDPGMTRAFDKFVSLVPGLSKSLDRFVQFSERQLKDAPSNIGSYLANMNAKQGLGLTDRVGSLAGVGGIGQMFGGVVDGWTSMEDAAIGQVDAANAVVQAEANLLKARRELTEAQSEDVELSVKMQRRITDAVKALEEAKAAPVAKSDDGSKKAAKIAKAEEKLRRVREDAAGELEKNGAEAADRIIQAQKAVTDAEMGLSQARGVVKAAAQATGHAEIAMALEIAELGVEIAKFISGLGQAFYDAQAKAAAAIREHFTALAQQAQMVADMRKQIVGLSFDYVKAQIEMAAATRQRRLTEIEAHLDTAQAVADVASAQAAFDAQRRADAKAQLSLYDDLSKGLGRFRWDMAESMNAAMGELAAWSDESHALYSELLAAQVGVQLAEKMAAKSSLEATYKQIEASFKLQETTQNLAYASQQLAIMSKNNFGMDQVGATVGERYAKLAEELSKIEAQKWDARTWGNPANWFNGTYDNANRRQDQIRQEMAELEKRREFQQLGVTPGEVKDLLNAAGWSGLFGAGDQVGDLIRNSRLGDAARASEKAAFEKSLLDIRKQQEDLKLQTDKGRAEVDYLKQLQPLQDLIESLKLERRSHESAAKGWRAQDEAVRKAYMNISKIAADGATKVKERTVVQVPEGKTAFSFDEVQHIIDGLGGEIESTKSRVEKLENPVVSSHRVAVGRRG